MRTSFLNVLNVCPVGTENLVLKREAEELSLSHEFCMIDAVIGFARDLDPAYEEGKIGSRHHLVVSLEIQCNLQES